MTVCPKKPKGETVAEGIKPPIVDPIPPCSYTNLHADTAGEKGIGPGGSTVKAPV